MKLIAYLFAGFIANGLLAGTQADVQVGIIPTLVCAAIIWVVADAARGMRG